MLISRLMKVIDDDEYKQDEVTEPPSLDAAQLYVLRVNGHTTQNSAGVGIGLVIYNPENNKELWSGSIYSSGDRAGFEAEYSAIIVGLDFAKTYGIQKLIVQSSNDAIVCQINGLYKVNKTSLKRMLKIEKAMEKSFSDFSIQEIASGENVKASEMARKALATRKSLNIPDSWKFDDPIEAVERDPEESMRKEPDDPALNADIDPSRIYLLRFDGGSRGNPGIAGAGMVLYDDQGQEIW
jgi:ribonuclease HI